MTIDPSTHVPAELAAHLEQLAQRWERLGEEARRLIAESSAPLGRYESVRAASGVDAESAEERAGWGGAAVRIYDVGFDLIPELELFVGSAPAW